MITIILEMLVRFQPDSLKYCFNMDNGYVEIIDIIIELEVAELYMNI